MFVKKKQEIRNRLRSGGLPCDGRVALVHAVDLVDLVVDAVDAAQLLLAVDAGQHDALRVAVARHRRLALLLAQLRFANEFLQRSR